MDKIEHARQIVRLADSIAEREHADAWLCENIDSNETVSVGYSNGRQFHVKVSRRHILSVVRAELRKLRSDMKLLTKDQ